jgi:2-iminoacetate synthase ThiH
MARRDLEHLIQEAQRTPLERDTLYRTVQSPEPAPRSAAAG